jgi:hypothetical protein
MNTFNNRQFHVGFLEIVESLNCAILNVVESRLTLTCDPYYISCSFRFRIEVGVSQQSSEQRRNSCYI